MYKRRPAKLPEVGPAVKQVVAALAKLQYDAFPRWYYIERWVDRDERTSEAYALTENFNNAKDFGALKPAEKLDRIIMLRRIARARGHRLRVLNVTRLTSFTQEDADFSDDQILERVQQLALEKLSEEEVEALGATRIAVYMKTKYHGVEATDDD